MPANYRRLRRFRRDESGNATVEACLWIPFFLSFFVLILDASTIFMNEARAQRIVQDANRQFVEGVFKTATDPEDALEAWIETALGSMAPSVDATAAIDGASGILTTRVTYPASETDLTGATGFFGGLTMRVQAVHQTES